MASSSGSLDTSANSHPASFTFSTHPFMTTSFSDLLASPNELDAHNTTLENRNRSLSDRIAERTGSGVPKFKSIPPPLPISPPAVSPSSYFAIPAGLSPAELLDSPVLLNSSNVSFFFFFWCVCVCQSFCFAFYVTNPFRLFEKIERNERFKKKKKRRDMFEGCSVLEEMKELNLSQVKLLCMTQLTWRFFRCFLSDQNKFMVINNQIKEA